MGVLAASWECPESCVRTGHRTRGCTAEAGSFPESDQRTATRDVRLGGTDVKEGDRLALCYSSANFDETVFTDPHRFDITRSPNPHLGFGGTGAHYCIGANLARLEIDLMFNAIADAMPAIRQAGPPRRLRSGWLNGIKELPVHYA